MNIEGMRAKLAASVANKPWYDIKNLSSDEVDLILYDEISWFGVTAQDFMKDLGNVTASKINLRLSSPGGDIFDGIAISNALRAHRAYVKVYVDGIAASIASVIAMAGDRVVMMPHSQLMIHDGSGGCYGNADDMTKMAELLNFQSDNIAEVYASKAGGTAEEWRTRMKEETWYTAEDAVSIGLADEVASFPRRDDEEEQEDEPYANKAGDLLNYEPVPSVVFNMNFAGPVTSEAELFSETDKALTNENEAPVEDESIEPDPEPELTPAPDVDPPPGFGGDWSDLAEALFAQSDTAWDDAVAHLTRRIPA